MKEEQRTKVLPISLKRLKLRLRSPLNPLPSNHPRIFRKIGEPCLCICEILCPGSPPAFSVCVILCSGRPRLPPRLLIYL